MRNTQAYLLRLLWTCEVTSTFCYHLQLRLQIVLNRGHFTSTVAATKRGIGTVELVDRRYVACTEHLFLPNVHQWDVRHSRLHGRCHVCLGEQLNTKTLPKGRLYTDAKIRNGLYVCVRL